MNLKSSFVPYDDLEDDDDDDDGGDYTRFYRLLGM